MLKKTKRQIGLLTGRRYKKQLCQLNQKKTKLKSGLTKNLTACTLLKFYRFRVKTSLQAYKMFTTTVQDITTEK